MPKQAKNSIPLKANEYGEFIRWIATPAPLRKPKTQKELASKLKVDNATLSDWKQRVDFNSQVKRELTKWAREKTPRVVLSLYKKILKTGSAQEVKLWLQTFEDFEDKTQMKFAGMSNQDLVNYIIAKITRLK